MERIIANNSQNFNLMTYRLKGLAVMVQTKDLNPHWKLSIIILLVVEAASLKQF